MNSPSNASTETIWVGMRLRPLVERERGQPHCLRIEGPEVHVVEDALDSERRMDVHRASFAFDVAMDSTDPNSPDYVSQEKCYEIMGGRMVEHLKQGFNTCLFCYGQTGTGKTTTIMGSAQPRRERGLLMRLVDDIFLEAEKQQAAGCQVHVVMQMLEVYNEKLNDLLAEPDPNSPNALKKNIKIHVHPELGVYLTGATEAPVKTAEECVKTIEYGNTMKVVHATAMNAQSSRGHTICKLTVVKEGGKDQVTSNSEVYFADLAGRENERSTQVTGERFVELGFINKSLHHLSNCIRELGQTEKRRKSICAESFRSKVAPSDMSKFRNSKLTLLLSNALSGNSRTSMIGTLSPAPTNFEESHNTLKFASTVKTIKVQAKAAKALDKEATYCHERLPLDTTGPEMRRMLSAVITRNFALKAKGPGLAMLPFIDFFNHCRVTRRGGSIEWTCSFQERESSVVLVAARPIAPEEELTFVYVSAPDAVLLVQYAMPPEEGNAHNMAGVEVFPEDVVNKEMWPVLQQWGWNGLEPLFFTVRDMLEPDMPIRTLAELLDGQVPLDSVVPLTSKDTRKRGRRKRKTCHGSSSGAVGLLISWLQRAQRQLVPPVQDGVNQELRAAVRSVVLGEAMVLEHCLEQLQREALLAELRFEKVVPVHRDLESTLQDVVSPGSCKRGC